jgi:hypothetical protein
MPNEMKVTSSNAPLSSVVDMTEKKKKKKKKKKKV